MIAIRLSKILLVAAIALTCTLVVVGNIAAPSINLSLVKHVLSMDTVLADSGIADRSITAPALQSAAFILIVTGKR